MQQIDNTLLTALEQDHEISGSPLVIAEWNFNRLIKTTVKNISDPEDKLWSYTKTHFPPSSITDGYRPDLGMIYAFTGSAYPISDAQLGSGGRRYYLCSKNAQYKYWVSPTTSSSVSGSYGDNAPTPGEFPIENSNLLVEYSSYVKSNKVKVTFNAEVRPTSWRISVFDKVSNGWVQIAENPTIDDIKGRCEIWWDGSAWVQDQQLDAANYREINAIKVEIDRIDTPNERVHLIEIAAMREMDITDRSSNYSVSMTMDDVDYIHPVGQVSSNDGSIVIDNRDLLLDVANPEQDYYGLMDGWCEYRTYVKFDMSAYGTSDKIVRMGTMHSNGWQGGNPFEFEVQLFDLLKVLQGIKCPMLLVENKSIARIISMILDMVGVDKYEFDFEDFDATGIIKYFWTDGTESVYDVLNRICKSHQCIVFVDEFGLLQLMTRDQIVNDEDTEDVILRGQDEMVNGTKKLANIITLSKKYDISINDVEIKYKRREANIDAQDVTGKVLTSKVWDTTDTVVLKASPLHNNVSATAVPGQLPNGSRPADVYVHPDEAETWPYSGYANLDGEVIKYEGKGYAVVNYQTGLWSEKIIKSNEDRRKWDKFTYDSYQPDGGAPGGGSGSPVGADTTGPGSIVQNRLTGRLIVTERGVDGTKWSAHSKSWIDGWMAFNVWVQNRKNPNYSTNWIEPGLKYPITVEELQDWRSKPKWGVEQRRWTVKDSILHCDNTGKSNWDQLTAQIRDLDDTEYREFGTRVRFTEGNPCAGIIFNISGDDGYFDGDATQEFPMSCHRAYMVDMHSTDNIEAGGRQGNEIAVSVKNGDSITKLEPQFAKKEDAGKFQINKNQWYDLEVIAKDMVMPDGSGSMRIEVFVNGQFIDTFVTNDVIRPTNLAGVYGRYSGRIQFEHFYATTLSGFARPKYSDEEAFNTMNVELPAGDNQTRLIDFPMNIGWLGRPVVSMATLGNATITSMEVITELGQIKSKIGPVTLLPESRHAWVIDDLAGAKGQPVNQLKVKYSSAEDISVVFETSRLAAAPYFGYKNEYPNHHSYYSLAKGGYISSKFQNIVSMPTTSFDARYSNDLGVYGERGLFLDDFGSIVREIRDFNVDLQVAPAKGTRVYVSNPEVWVIKNQYNPKKGIFTLVNASHDDQIVSGTETIDESNSIDHSLMVYGYILVDKEEKTKRVKNEDSIRKHGSYPVQLDAEWITSDAEAEALATWIVDHWGGIMDTIEVETFGTIHLQIGDKVKVRYDHAHVDSDWLFIVTGINKDFDDNGLSTSLTLRRVL